MGARKLIGRELSAPDLARFLQPDVEAEQAAPTSPMSGARPGRRHLRRNDVKYLLLIYGNETLWESFPPETMEEVIKETNALQAELRASGEFIGAYGVADQEMAKTVRLENGAPVVSDGPYIEAKEYIGSIDIIDCENLERALEIAAMVPFARIGSVEVRPLMHEAAPDV
jgi:hypothetical protein